MTHGSVVRLIPIFALLTGCTSFGAVRSAQIAPGGRLEFDTNLSTPPGQGSGFSWKEACVEDCDHPMPSLSASVLYGVASENGTPFEVGGGLIGFSPYAEAFVQLSDGPVPFGVGLRMGLTSGNSREDALYVAYDVPRGDDSGVIMTTSLLRKAYTGPTGSPDIRFVALAQGLGWQEGRERSQLAPYVVLVLGHTRQANFGRPTSSLNGFMVFGLRMSFGGK